ncbi:MAG: hypothetical protein K2N78_13065, partial [Oscillospiraceae bacterium]|nr:hypothetical protein [Oscillospiraceae bacterium]
IGQEHPADGEMTANSIERIPYGAYNFNGIYAGTVARDVEILESRYIDVALTGKTYGTTGATDPYQVRYDTWNTPVYRIERNSFDTEAYELGLTNWDPTDQVHAGDRVIIVVNSGTAFIVDLGPDNSSVGTKVDYNIPTWLDQQWWMISLEQVFTNGSGSTNWDDEHITSYTLGTVEALKDAIQEAEDGLGSNASNIHNDVYHAKKLAEIFLDLGRTNSTINGEMAYANVIEKLTTADMDDILAGLNGARNTVGGDYRDEVDAAITAADLAKAVIQARIDIPAAFEAANDKIPAVGNGEGEISAEQKTERENAIQEANDAALEQLKGAATLGDVKDIVDAAKAAMNAAATNSAAAATTVTTEDPNLTITTPESKEPEEKKATFGAGTPVVDNKVEGIVKTTGEVKKDPNDTNTTVVEVNEDGTLKSAEPTYRWWKITITLTAEQMNDWVADVDDGEGGTKQVLKVAVSTLVTIEPATTTEPEEPSEKTAITSIALTVDTTNTVGTTLPTT